MAIIPHLPSLSVAITVDGRRANEYQDSDYKPPQGQKETEKYIEAKTAAKFAIVITSSRKIGLNGSSLEYEIIIDGKSVDCRTVEDPGKSFRHEIEGISLAQNGSKLKFRPFVFSPMDIVEEDPNVKVTEKMIKTLGSVGTINVTFYRTDIISTRRAKASDWMTEGLGDMGKIPEKALKGSAKSLNAALGDAIDSGLPSKDIVFTTRQPKPLWTFRFKYRSRKALEELGLIVPLERRPVEELSVEQLRDLVRQQQAARDTVPLPQVKQEREPGPVSTFNTKKHHTDDDDCSFVDYRPAKRLRTEVEVIDEEEPVRSHFRFNVGPRRRGASQYHARVEDGSEYGELQDFNADSISWL